MKSIILIIGFGIVSSSKLPNSFGQNSFTNGQQIRILKNDFKSDGIGNYKFSYETENGISHNEEGHVEHDDDKIVRGSYSYNGDDGAIYTVHYYADANGFHASGDHLPGTKNSLSKSSTINNYRAKPVNNMKIVNSRLTSQINGNGYRYKKPSIGYLPVH